MEVIPGRILTQHMASQNTSHDISRVKQIFNKIQFFKVSELNEIKNLLNKRH